MMASVGDDCYFFYYSTCKKGSDCPFRHCTEALGTEIICTLWSKTGKCFKEQCPFRHMKIGKSRDQTVCFWETQPGGCRKPHCVFKHLRTRPDFDKLSSTSAVAGDSSKPVAEAKAAAKPSALVSQGPSTVVAPRPKSKHVWVNPSIAVADSSESPVQLRRTQPVLPPILPSVDFGNKSNHKNGANGDHDQQQRTASSTAINPRRRVIQRNQNHDEENDPMARPKRGDLRGRLTKRKNDESGNKMDVDPIGDDVMTKLSALFDSGTDRSTDLIVQELLKGDSDRKKSATGAPPVKLRKKWKHNDDERPNGVSRSETNDSEPDSALISMFGKDLAHQLKSEGIDLNLS